MLVILSCFLFIIIVLGVIGMICWTQHLKKRENNLKEELELQKSTPGEKNTIIIKKKDQFLPAGDSKDLIQKKAITPTSEFNQVNEELSQHYDSKSQINRGRQDEKELSIYTNINREGLYGTVVTVQNKEIREKSETFSDSKQNSYESPKKDELSLVGSEVSGDPFYAPGTSKTKGTPQYSNLTPKNNNTTDCVQKEENFQENPTSELLNSPQSIDDGNVVQVCE